jgi:hypothetical protein
MMAGHRRMSVRMFVPLLSLGIALKLAVIWAGGKLLEDQLEAMLDFITKYQWWLVGGLFGLSFLQSGRKMRNGQLPVPPDEPPAAD